MAKVFSKGNTNFEPAPADVHNGVCVGVYDIGTHVGNYGAKRTVRILFEIDAQRNDGKNFIVNRDYGFTISKKSKLREMIEAWRGKPFTEAEESEGFDLAKLLGQSCAVQIIHKQVGADTYANIGGITKLMKGMQPMKPTYPLCSYFFDDHGKNIPAGTPDWVAKKIKESQEWSGKVEPGVQDSREQFDAGTVEEQAAVAF